MYVGEGGKASVLELHDPLDGGDGLGHTGGEDLIALRGDEDHVLDSHTAKLGVEEMQYLILHQVRRHFAVVQRWSQQRILHARTRRMA